MAKKGYIYKGLKPVYWCPDCRTALAEAEIEYGEDDCDSIFVRFHVSQDPNGVLAKHGIPMDKTYFVIWTTTTWTLPANEAICLNGAFEYSFVKIGEEYHIMATELVKSVMDACHIENYEIVGEPVSGAEFELMRYHHVYLPKEGWVILGDHVTLESGSGCVHTAGGHFHGRRSKDLVNWEYLGGTMKNLPEWVVPKLNEIRKEMGLAEINPNVNDFGYWAPVVRKVKNGLYRMYYSIVCPAHSTVPTPGRSAPLSA